MKKVFNIVVTGGNSGIGYETVKSLYEQGHSIIFGARNQARNQQIISEISQKPGGKIQAFKLDLSARKSIENFVKEVELLFDRVDILVNNSGAVMMELSRNEDGIQSTLATNHFGHFYLTYLLWKSILRSPQARIINVSSMAHYYAPADYLDDIKCQSKVFSSNTQYAISKLFNVVFTQGITYLLNDNNITHVKVASLHPGIVVTGFGEGSTLVKISRILCCCIYIGQVEGARTSLHLCRVPFQEFGSGEYYHSNTRVKEMDPRARTKHDIDKLWKISEQVYKIEWK